MGSIGSGGEVLLGGGKQVVQRPPGERLVTGALALLLSAWPQHTGLVWIQETILTSTAEWQEDTSCGPAGPPNNVWGWGILELSGLFFGLALAAGPAGGLSLDDTVRSFVQGAADITYAALIVGLARATLVVLRDARVLDTITRALVVAIQGWSSWLSAVGIYVIQNLLHFLVPSGSGQAAVSMPILAPLGDLVGVTRQTNVLAYQLGNGLTNVFIPTQGYFMAALGILRIPWTTWVRWLLPLLLAWLAIGCAAVILASVIRLGPF